MASIADRSSIRLDLDHVDVDIERWFAQTDDDAIVAGYDGEFLPDDRYDDWSAPLRDEIRARFGAAVRRLRRSATRVTRSSSGGELLTQEPYDEGAHRALVATLRAEGRLSEARTAYQTYVAAMDDLGVTRRTGTTSCAERRGGSERISKGCRRMLHHDKHHRCHHRFAPVGARRSGRPPLLPEPPGHREGRRRRFGLRTRARRVRRAARVRPAAAPCTPKRTS